MSPGFSSEKTKIERIARDLHDRVFKRMWSWRQTVFLVGPSTHGRCKLREHVARELGKGHWSGKFEVHFPERLFEELMDSGNVKDRFDLLTLENLLGESVSAIVILLQSHGAIAELGAFANHTTLKDRLVVVVNARYEGAKNFIMLGPIRYLKDKTKSRIVYHDLDNPNLATLVSAIRNEVRQLIGWASVRNTIDNPVLAQDFIRAAIYVLEPLPVSDLAGILATLVANGDERARVVASAATCILRDANHLSLQNGSYWLTDAGAKALLNSFGSRTTRAWLRAELDKLRVAVLNIRYRRM